MLKKKLTRCFINLELPSEAVAEIKNIQQEIKERFSLQGKFTELQNLHLTLKFLGEIDDETIKKVREQLKTIIIHQFNVKLGEVGVFSEKIVRIVWVKLAGAERLQQAVDQTLVDLFPREERFMGHITLARVKSLSNEKLFFEHLKKTICNSVFTVNKFFLKQSILTHQGAVYKTLSAYSLQKKYF